jgi:PKD repeat protein
MRSVALLGLVLLLLSAGGNIPPRADYLFSPAKPRAGELVRFDATSSTDEDGEIIKYEWDFDGDGVFNLTSSDPLTEHIFTESGSKKVTLKVTDDKGAVDTTTKVIEVKEAIVIAFRTITTPLEPNKAMPGDTLKVRIEIKVKEDIGGLGLDEDPPEGWTLRPIEGDAAFKGSPYFQWLWAQSIPSDTSKVVIYEIKVPRNIAPGVYTIEGFLSSFSPRFKVKVEGDSEVVII